MDDERTDDGAPVVVIVSADAEWAATRAQFPQVILRESPLGEWFTAPLPGGDGHPVRFFHGGFGKIAAAASAQYVIDRWRPGLLVNLGACGGFAGRIERDEIVLAERTVVYDILDQMTEGGAAIAKFSTDLDLSWLGDAYPHDVRRTLLVSADRDLVVEELADLADRYGAVAGDWESGAIAYVAARNRTRCLILRGVSDLVGEGGGEAYAGGKGVWEAGSERIMRRLIAHMPAWLALVRPIPLP